MTTTTNNLTNEERSQIAKTIIEQFGGNMFVMMTGSKNFMSLSEGGLQFDIGRNENSVTRCRVILTPDDLYTVTFYKGRGLKIRVHRELENMSCESLQRVFTLTTGLQTSLTHRWI